MFNEHADALENALGWTQSRSCCTGTPSFCSFKALYLQRGIKLYVTGMSIKNKHIKVHCMWMLKKYSGCCNLQSVQALSGVSKLYRYVSKDWKTPVLPANEQTCPIAVGKKSSHCSQHQARNQVCCSVHCSHPKILWRTWVETIPSFYMETFC